MIRKLIHTSNDPLLLLMRAVLGVIFFAHGAQKVLGWYGGPGFDATIGMFSRMLHIPPALAILSTLAEFLGGIGLVVGLFTRVAAFGIAINMVVAVLLVHLHNGLFMNWQGNQPGEGFEYHLLALAIAVMLTVKGAGAFSLDRALDRPAHSSPPARLPRAA